MDKTKIPPSPLIRYTATPLHRYIYRYRNTLSNSSPWGEDRNTLQNH